jgi:hypothetical protein
LAPVPMPTYGTLPSVGLLNTLIKQKNTQHYTPVGYGLEQSGPHTALGGDTRRRADQMLVNLNGVFGTGKGNRQTALLVRGSRSATGQVLDGLLDTDNVPLDILQVQPPSNNLTASDLKQRHPAHLKGLPVAAGAGPPPFGPGRVTVLDRPADLGAEVRDAREHGLPVGEHLGPPGEGPARMRRLLAAVILMDETGHGIKIMRVHGRVQPVNHFGHQALPLDGVHVPGLSACRCAGTKSIYLIVS